jgi:hypothetical protein
MLAAPANAELQELATADHSVPFKHSMPVHCCNISANPLMEVRPTNSSSSSRSFLAAGLEEPSPKLVQLGTLALMDSHGLFDRV